MSTAFHPAPPGLEVIEPYLEDGKLVRFRCALIGWAYTRVGVFPITMMDEGYPDYTASRGVLFPDGHVETRRQRFRDLESYLEDEGKRLRKKEAKPKPE